MTHQGREKKRGIEWRRRLRFKQTDRALKLVRGKKKMLEKVLNDSPSPTKKISDANYHRGNTTDTFKRVVRELDQKKHLRES